MRGSKSKEYTRLIDTVSGEIMVSADLTPAGVRRLVKEYARFGYELAVA